MSQINVTKVAQPATPASNIGSYFIDTADNRPKVLDYNGILNVLAARELFNYLRNGGKWFAQRQVPGTLTTYSNTTGRSFAADGWGITNENASVQYIRTDTSGAVETGLQGRYYGTYSKITNTGKIMVSQVLEGHDTNSLRGRTVRFQLWLKASAAKTLKIAVIQNNSSATLDTVAATFISAFGANTVDPTLGTNLAFVAPKSGVTPDNCTAGTNAFSCAVTTAWQRFGGAVDVPTTCKNLIVMVWTDSQFAAADSFSMAQASLTDGYEVQDWSPFPYSAELQRVQRFYCKTWNVDSTPAQNTGVNTGEFRFMAGKVGALAEVSPTFFFPVQMRAAPSTNTTYNPAAANAQVRDITGAVDCTAAAIAGATERGAYVTATGNAATAVGNHLGVHLSFDAEI